MNLNQLSTPAGMERSSFLWSEARLVIGAVALFLGGIPPALFVFGRSGIVVSLLRVAWILSGLASAYLGYRWFKGSQRVFGGKDRLTSGAFLVSVLTGLNLGWTGLTGNNVGMSIASGRGVFIITGIIYLAVAAVLLRAWQAHGQRVF